jgi:hypothetical protein
VTTHPTHEPATEYQKGAATAHALVLRQIDAGHSPDRIAAIQEDTQRNFDEVAATPGQREWFKGYQATVAEIVQTYRDAERAEAQLPDIEAAAGSRATNTRHHERETRLSQFRREHRSWSGHLRQTTDRAPGTRGLRCPGWLRQ